MPRKPLFKSKMQEWIEEMDARMLSGKTIRTYRQRMNQNYDYARTHDWPMNPRLIAPGHIREYYDSLQTKSSSTQLAKLGTLLRFLEWSGNERCSKVRLRIRVSRTHVDWLTEEAVSRVLRTSPSPKVRAMETCFALTGIRRSELVTLRLKDVKDREIVVRGKGRKERVIPINRTFWGWITPYLLYREKLPQHDLFLVHRHGGVSKGYDEESVTTALTRHGGTLGFRLTPHTLRRSFGRILYKNGCPIGELSVMFGHSSVEMTMRYLGIGIFDTSEAIDRYLPDFHLQAEQERRKVYLGTGSQLVPTTY